MKKIALYSLVITAVFAAAWVFAPSTLAAENIDGCTGPNCLNSVSTGPSALNIPDISLNRGARRALGVLLAAAGVLSTIFLVLGGIKYTSSNGDPAKVASAKNTITYAIIGLIISITAGLIVGFVLGNTPG